MSSLELKDVCKLIIQDFKHTWEKKKKISILINKEVIDKKYRLDG